MKDLVTSPQALLIVGGLVFLLLGLLGGRVKWGPVVTPQHPPKAARVAIGSIGVLLVSFGILVGLPPMTVGTTPADPPTTRFDGGLHGASTPPSDSSGSISSRQQVNSATPAATTPTTATPPLPPPLASTGLIQYPADSAVIPQATVATGAAANVLEGHQVWLFVVPINSDTYYSGNGVRDGHEQYELELVGGMWRQEDLEFGAVDDPVGGQFYLVLLDLAPAGVARMQQYRTNHENGMSGSQLMSLGTRELDRVRVIRG